MLMASSLSGQLGVSLITMEYTYQIELQRTQKHNISMMLMKDDQIFEMGSIKFTFSFNNTSQFFNSGSLLCNYLFDTV